MPRRAGWGGLWPGCWDGGAVRAVSVAPPAAWRALIVLPEKPLATIASRAVLPESYSRADVVANLQRVAVLTAAFAAGRGDLIGRSDARPDAPALSQRGVSAASEVVPAGRERRAFWEWR